MKKFLFSTLAVLFSISTFATVRTVFNGTPSPGYFSTVAAAVTASSDGDTIYVMGSSGSYGSTIINKKLTIIGPGVFPKKDLGVSSFFDNIYVASDSVVLSGLESSYIYLTYTVANNNILIKNCLTAYLWNQANLSLSNVIVEGCVITGYLSLGNSIQNNLLFRNNIFATTPFAASINSVKNASFDHNVFHHLRAGYSIASSVSNCLFTNNIFLSIFTTGTINCQFNNNVSFYTGQTTNIQLPQPGNTGVNNQVQVNPQFVNPILNPFSIASNYRLQPTSPILTAGISGAEPGVYGGSGIFLATFEPEIPVIRSFTIFNPTLPATGSLNVNIKASSRVDR